MVRRPSARDGRTLRTLARVALALIVALVAFMAVYRPLHLRWGATLFSAKRAMTNATMKSAKTTLPAAVRSSS